MKQKIATGCGKYNVFMEPVDGLQCNRCKLKLEPDTPEFYDALHWEDIGGYGSFFGDGTKVSLTLCAPCLHLLAGDCIVKTDTDVL